MLRHRRNISKTIVAYLKPKSVSLDLHFYDNRILIQRIRPPSPETFGPISVEVHLQGMNVENLSKAIRSILADEKKRFDLLYPHTDKTVFEIEITTFTERVYFNEVLELLYKEHTQNSVIQHERIVLFCLIESGDLPKTFIFVEKNPDLINLYCKKTAFQIAKENNHLNVVKPLK